MLTQSSDTHLEIENILISLIRQQSTAKRTSQMCSLSQTTRKLSKRAIKRANPTLSEQELNQLFVNYLYGLKLENRFCRVINHKISMKKSDIIIAVEPIITAFDQLGILYYIAGSVASSVYGMPRATQDVDFVTDLKLQSVNLLVEMLQDAYYIDKDMILDAIKRSASFNLLHLETMIKIDIFIVKEGPYHRSVLQRRRADTLDEEDNALKFYLASSEDVILSKLDWFRKGNQISDQQWRDIQGVMKVQKNHWIWNIY